MNTSDPSAITEMELLEECYRCDMSYQDYLSKAELYGRSPMSERLFKAHMETFYFKSL